MTDINVLIIHAGGGPSELFCEFAPQALTAQPEANWRRLWQCWQCWTLSQAGGTQAPGKTVISHAVVKLITNA